MDGKIIKIRGNQYELILAALRSEQERISSEIEKLSEELEVLKQQYDDNDTTIYEITHSTPEEDFADDPILVPDTSHPILVRPYLKTNINGYKINWSWWDKTRYILTKAEKVLSAKEIIDLVIEHEPEYKQATDEIKKKLSINVFATLSHKTKNNQLGRIKEGKESKYGLVNWFDKDGNIIKEYSL